MAKHKSPVKEKVSETTQVFTVEVNIIFGPMSDRFMERNPTVSRTIQIRGDQTLDDLHESIFDAFGRYDEHLYEFQLGGKKPMDRKAKRYVHPEVMDYSLDEEEPPSTEETKLNQLDLKKRKKFFYWFDFGDDWWHEIRVIDIEEKVAKDKYPRVTKRVGKSPPQYGGWG